MDRISVRGQRTPERIELGKPDCGYIEIDPTGRYGRFHEVLGSGATKTVYRAFDEMDGVEVAWNQAKINDIIQSSKELQRLHSEVHLLRTLNHDYVLRFYDSWIDTEKRALNFITEMFTSGTLREYRRRYKRVNIKAVKNWARQILQGLMYLHEHDPPVIHRDLKCDNIFVNGHLGQVKIGDLGLAAILKSSQAVRTVIGTPEFMAPELYEEEYNELVDIYSFGMCMLEMLTLEYPYSECSNPAQIYRKVSLGKLPDAFFKISDLEIRRFIGKCLEKASKRPSARELLFDPFFQSSKKEPSPESGLEEFTWSPYHEKSESIGMRISGKMNPDGDTIFLKVKFMDNDGSARNVHFPFHLFSDTAIDVATEMVKELQIDHEPSDIAQVIIEEISSFKPHLHCIFNYKEGEHQLLYPPPSPSSSQSSHLGLDFYRTDEGAHHGHQINGDSFDDDEEDTCSHSSHCYSSYNYSSGNEYDAQLSPRHDAIPFSHDLKSSRFCLEHIREQQVSHGVRKSLRGPKSVTNRCLAKLKSFVDIRSQLYNRSLAEEMHKQRLFRTIGAVENIGFQKPSEISGRLPWGVPSRDDWHVKIKHREGSIG